MKKLFFEQDLEKEGEEIWWKLDRFDPKSTGLGMNIWVKTKYDTDPVEPTPRIYVGDSPDRKYAVSIDSVPALLDGLSLEEIGLTEQQFQELATWIYANKVALLDYWDGKICTCDLVYAHFPYTGAASVFEVEKVTVESLPERCRQHYPKYKLHSWERAICTSLAQAEEVLKKYVEKYKEEHPKDWCEDVFCYYIREYPSGVHLSPNEDWLLSWRLYNAEGEMIDRSICCGLNVNENFCKYGGRDDNQFRFKKGDIVEFVWNHEVELGFVVSLPPSIDFVKERRERIVQEFKEEMKAKGKAIECSDNEIRDIYSLDISDDSYIVLTTSDYVSHNHISTMDIFAPHYPVPNYMRKKLNESYQKFLKRYK